MQSCSVQQQKFFFVTASLFSILLITKNPQLRDCWPSVITWQHFCCVFKLEDNWDQLFLHLKLLGEGSVRKEAAQVRVCYQLLRPSEDVPVAIWIFLHMKPQWQTHTRLINFAVGRMATEKIPKKVTANKKGRETYSEAGYSCNKAPQWPKNFALCFQRIHSLRHCKWSGDGQPMQNIC